MQSPSASDPSFAKFLEDIKKQNSQQFATQLFQLKAEREIAGEDNDKREKQLDSINTELKGIRTSVIGADFSQMLRGIDNQTQLLTKSLEELSIIRKINEGSLEYDKESAQYRNTSGREITSVVSGKEIKKGGYVDFETAADRLTGQGKRVRESEGNKLKLTPIDITSGSKVPRALGAPEEPNADIEKTKYQGFFEELKSGIKFFLTDGKSEEPGYGMFQKPPKDVIKKEREQKISSDRQKVESPENPESDNVVSATEAQADYAKQDLDLSKQLLDTTKEQLKTLQEIRDALAPKTPAELQDRSAGKKGIVSEKDSEDGGPSLLDAGLGLGKKALGAIGRGAKAAGSAALGAGAKVARFAGSGAGKALGAAAAVGLGAYTAYKGYTAAEDSKQAKLEEVQAKVDAGELTPEQAAEQRKEIGNTATVEKSGAVGEGTGLAGGAIAGGMAGAKLGATIGTFVGGPVGTAIGAGVGTIAGGALGAFAGTKAGKYVGEKVGEGINYVGEKASSLGKGISDWFSNKKAEIKDTYNRGTGGTLAFQNKDQEINKRAKEAGIIDKDGNITDYDKYNKISKQVTDEIKTADPSANKLATQAVSAKEELTQKEISQGGVTTSTTEMKGGTVAEKSVLGSTTLGSLFSAKGLEVGGFLGSSEKSRVTTGKVEGRDISSQEQKTGSILGRRIASGSLFKSDTYKVAGASGEEMDVSKSDYFKIQKLAKEGKTEEAEKLMANIKMSREVSKEVEAGIKSPEESLTPVSPGAKGLSVVKDSIENKDLNREVSSKPTNVTPIVSNNVTTTNTTKYVPVKAEPRTNSSSSLSRYLDRIAVY